MSYIHPPHPGGQPGPPPGYPSSYAGPPAYSPFPPPTPQPSGMNPWVAGLIGALLGGVGAMVLSFVVPMIFFGLVMGAGFGGPFDDGFADEPSRVEVAVDGSVPGLALADALEESDWYDDMTCPDTAKVATDVTTICRGSDGFEDMRVVVVFRGSGGEFRTADLFD